MQRYTNNIKKRIGKTIHDHNLISENDKILVALSGGKDSLILLEAFADRLRSLPFSFEILAAHIWIDNIGYKTDLEYLEAFCIRLGVVLKAQRFSIDLSDQKKSRCFICSWNRRKALFQFAKENNCNKLAFGHHMDDALQTLFMNMLYHGSISSLPYKLKMFDGELEVIRPLLDITNEELLRYADYMEYKKELKKCDYENTRRKEIEKQINTFCKNKRNMKVNMFRSMNNIYPEYLPGK